MIDFGNGPVKAVRFSWGDVFTAFYSTGIPNIENYAVLPEQTLQLLTVLGALRPLLKLAAVRNFIRSKMPTSPTPEQRARTRTFVWGEVQDDEGHKAASLLQGPEAGVTWTALTALATVQKVLAGHAPPGFQTPARAYGPDFVLECEGVTRQDVN